MVNFIEIYGMEGECFKNDADLGSNICFNKKENFIIIIILKIREE